MDLREAGEGLEERKVLIIRYPREVDENGRIYVGKNHAGKKGLLLLIELKDGDKIRVEN